jgi:hypothetical protein
MQQLKDVTLGDIQAIRTVNSNAVASFYQIYNGDFSKLAFELGYIIGDISKFVSAYKPINKSWLETLTKEELISIGFSVWDSKDKTVSMLIPLYLHRLLNKDDVYTSINKKQVKVSDMDLDTRFGCLAFYLELPVRSLSDFSADANTHEKDYVAGLKTTYYDMLKHHDADIRKDHINVAMISFTREETQVTRDFSVSYPHPYEDSEVKETVSIVTKW